MRAIEPEVEATVTIAREVPFPLDNGTTLQPVAVHYAAYGTLNAARDNAVLACHALSGSARVADWWPEMFAGYFDLERDFVLGINALGSCYGSTGPSSSDPRTGAAYGPAFPVVTVRDMVRAQAYLLNHLGIERLRAVIGGSIGGMQALQWAIDYPERVERCIAVGAAPLGAMGLAMNHLQRQAIRLDAAFHGGRYRAQPAAGMALARGIAMCTYKSAELFEERFARRPDRGGEDPARSLEARFDIGGYLDHQGEKLVGRFDANSYLALSRAMDLFDPASGYENEAEALRRVTAEVLLVGISSDWLFPPPDVARLAARLRAAGARARYVEMQSAHGHDAFLAEAVQVAALLRASDAEQAAIEIIGDAGGHHASLA